MKEDKNFKLLFTEKQKFRETWVWIILFAITLIVISVFGSGFYQQLILGKEWGNNPLSDSALIVIGVFYILLVIAIDLLFFAMVLTVEVKPEGIYINFYPFLKKVISYDDIKSVQAITYKPVLEYGGWGVRWGFKGKAYNVSGNKGVKIFFKNGKNLLIGSQKSEELFKAITEGMNSAAASKS